MNQKITQLRIINPNDVARGDLVPLVDISDMSSPTGETKHISAEDLGVYLASIISPSYSPYQTATSLWFDEAVVGNSVNTVCYTPLSSSGLTNLSLSVRAMFPSSSAVNDPDHRVIFGVGPSPVTSSYSAHSAYIGRSGKDLVGHIQGPIYYNTAVIPDFFAAYADKTTHITMIILNGEPSFYVNGVPAASYLNSTGAPGTITPSFIVMGQSRGTNNVDCTVYEAQVWDEALNDSRALEAFFAGPRNESGLISSYVPSNLNPEPSQWIDSIGRNHLLLPTSGITVNSPAKKFSLRFEVTGSGYLGNGTARNVLPENYFLTWAVVSSSAKPLVALGSSPTTPTTGSSGTGSFFNNRVAWTSASYGISDLNILSLGASHSDRSLFVSMSGDNVCSFNFEGYIRD